MWLHEGMNTQYDPAHIGKAAVIVAGRYVNETGRIVGPVGGYGPYAFVAIASPRYVGELAKVRWSSVEVYA